MDGVVDQWLTPVEGVSLPLIEVDVDTLEEDGAVMQFYNKLVMLVCGTKVVEHVNVCEFSDFVGFNFPHNPANKGYFVRFNKRMNSITNSITILVMSGNLYVQCFQVNKGIVYVLGNDQTMSYEKNRSLYKKKVLDYETDITYYKEIKEREVESGVKTKLMRKPKEPKVPEVPYVYQCLECYGLNAHINLKIGSSYPKLQRKADKNRNEISFGMRSLNVLFNKLLNFELVDTPDAKTAAEFGLFGAVFVSESIRLLDQAMEMADFFRRKVDHGISDRNWKMHLVWSFASKVVRLKRDEEARGVQRTNRYRVLVDGVHLDENDLETKFWTLKNGNTNVEDLQEDAGYLSKDYIFNLDKKSLDLK